MFKREAKRFCFYFCFYTALLAFFSLMMAIFFRTIDEKKPKWILEESLIGSNPGLTMIPKTSSFINYDPSNNQSYKLWTNQIDDFLSIYRLKEYNEHKINCNFNHSPSNDDQTCAVDLRGFGPCNSDYQYGYSRGQPCVFFKLNKIFGWKPQYYNNSRSLPTNVPEDLKYLIRRSEQRRPEELNVIWFSCRGVTAVDQENIGPIAFYPTRGFPGYFFPYTNQYAYLSPLVAVFFERPTRHIVINVECAAWAPNLVHDYVEGRGAIRFDLLVE